MGGKPSTEDSAPGLPTTAPTAPDAQAYGEYLDTAAAGAEVAVAVVESKDMPPDEMAMMPMILVLAQLQQEPLRSEIVWKMIAGKEDKIHDWVFVLTPSPHELPADRPYVLIPGSLPNDVEWRPDIAIFNYGSAFYALCLDKRSKIRCPFKASLLQPNMWLVLLDAVGDGRRSCMTANMSVSKPPHKPTRVPGRRLS